MQNEEPRLPKYRLQDTALTVSSIGNHQESLTRVLHVPATLPEWSELNWPGEASRNPC